MTELPNRRAVYEPDGRNLSKSPSPARRIERGAAFRESIACQKGAGSFDMTGAPPQVGGL